VQVHYDEGVAIRIGPKPCAGIREGVGEASAGERIGQPLSRENKICAGCRRAQNHERQHGRGHYRLMTRPRPCFCIIGNTCFRQRT
jgi:hypothetical protein